jgi:DHA2 family multidrug resistance protein
MLREALTLTFSDTFLALTACFAVALVAVMFSGPFGNVGNQTPPPDSH